MKVVSILPNLLLQKPAANSKAKDHTEALVKRIQMWNEGNILDLLRDCRTIQNKLKMGKKRSPDDVNRVFSKLVFEGKIGAALKFLDENAEDAVLPSTPTVIEKLKLLHPPAAKILPHTLLQGPLNQLSPTNFASINEQEVMKAAMRTKGSGGPSLLDAKQWRRILTSQISRKKEKTFEKKLHDSRKWLQPKSSIHPH